MTKWAYNPLTFDELQQLETGLTLDMSDFTSGSVIWTDGVTLKQDNDKLFYRDTSGQEGLIVGDSSAEPVINLNGVTYVGRVRISDINSGNLTQLSLHRHASSVDRGTSILGSRARISTGIGHAIVQNNDYLFDLTATGWINGTNSYQKAASIRMLVDAVPDATVGEETMPGRIEFLTTPDANNPTKSVTPTLALSIFNDQTATAVGEWTFDGGLAVPTGDIGKFHLGSDLIFYTDDGTTPMATIDNTSGDLTITLANGGDVLITGGLTTFTDTNTWDQVIQANGYIRVDSTGDTGSGPKQARAMRVFLNTADGDNIRPLKGFEITSTLLAGDGAGPPPTEDEYIGSVVTQSMIFNQLIRGQSANGAETWKSAEIVGQQFTTSWGNSSYTGAYTLDASSILTGVNVVNAVQANSTRKFVANTMNGFISKFNGGTGTDTETSDKGGVTLQEFNHIKLESPTTKAGLKLLQVNGILIEDLTGDNSDGGAQTASVPTGIKIENQTGGSGGIGYGIVLADDGAGSDIVFGAGQEYKMWFDSGAGLGPFYLNAGAGAYDTCIQGDTDTALLYVDAVNDKVGISTASPAVLFDVLGESRFGDSATNYVTIEGDGDVTFVGGAGLAYGHMYNHNTVTAHTTAGGTWTELTSGLTTGNVHRCTFGASHYIAVDETGTYLIAWQASIKAQAGSVNDTIEGTIAIDGTANTTASAHRKLGAAGDEGSMSGVTILQLAANKQISFTFYDTTGNNTIDIEHLNMTVVQIAGVSA